MIDNNTNRGELLRQKFKSYVQARTIQNWKFYIFSTIINPLFDNYVNTVNDATKEEIRNWQREYLKIVNLRPRKLVRFRHIKSVGVAYTN